MIRNSIFEHFRVTAIAAWFRNNEAAPKLDDDEKRVTRRFPRTTRPPVPGSTVTEPSRTITETVVVRHHQFRHVESCRGIALALRSET